MTRDNLAGRHVTIRGARELRAADVAPAAIVRYIAKLKRTAATMLPVGCLIWTGAVNGDGYGIVRISSNARQESSAGRLVLAHRLAIALALGVCPADKVADHDGPEGCHIRACCEWSHLRMVTPEENTPGIYGGEQS